MAFTVFEGHSGLRGVLIFTRVAELVTVGAVTVSCGYGFVTDEEALIGKFDGIGGAPSKPYELLSIFVSVTAGRLLFGRNSLA